MQFFYLTVLLISSLATIIFVWRSNPSTDIYFSLLFTIIPIADVGYYMFSKSTNLEEALLSIKITYLGGCFLSLFIMMAVISMVKIKVNKAFTVTMMGLSFGMYGSILTIGFKPWFYKSAVFEFVNGNPHLIKEYGPMHTMLYVMLFLHAGIGIGAILYARARKESGSYLTMTLLLLTELICMATYFLGKVFSKNFDVTPASYIIFQVMFLGIMGRTGMYNIGRNQASALIDRGENGYFSLDLKGRFLGGNQTIKNFFPVIGKIRVDSFFNRGEHRDDFTEEIGSLIEKFRNAYEKDGNTHIYEHVLEKEDKFYRVVIEHLRTRNRIRGYQVSVIDETGRRRYTKLLENYNEKLEEEVSEKTEHIQEIQDKMVLGLATMVESRDASTGGHIKRTSHVVGILINAMRKDHFMDLDDEFCKCVVKAAPMHDIGKIAVDDDILRKPGRFTPEEYEEMKTHAAKGAVIVREVLADIEEPRFQQIAENVAHYHHERWDGSGYPEGLSGEDIPLEARIMAVADVYDALVSKRCYKDRMSFEQAFGIIEDGMGKHFDERLNKYFLEVRLKLEAYYSAEEA